MSFTFYINGTEFWIDEFDDGFNWRNAQNADGSVSFPTILEAQQDALEYTKNNIDFEHKLQACKNEDRIYGSYENQIAALNDYNIRH